MEYISREEILAEYDRQHKGPAGEARKIMETWPAADVAPVVRCAECKYNNHCLTQSFVEDASRIPFDRNTFFCADGVRQR